MTSKLTAIDELFLELLAGKKTVESFKEIEAMSEQELDAYLQVNEPDYTTKREQLIQRVLDYAATQLKEENDDEDLVEDVGAKVLPFVKPKAKPVYEGYGIEKKAASDGNDQKTVRLSAEDGKWFVRVGRIKTSGKSFLEFHCDQGSVETFRCGTLKITIGEQEFELGQVDEHGFAQIVVEGKINTTYIPFVQVFTADGNQN